jgi:osmotically inducible lipoprotein OsmB
LFRRKLREPSFFAIRLNLHMKGETDMSFDKILLMTAVCLSLAACGNSKQERALSGGGIGAGIGAAGSALTGGSPWTGAIIGGAAGAATGALTDRDDIDLGDFPD